MTRRTLREYRIKYGIELTQTQHAQTPSVFTISDLHLNHKNIIAYCNRPFNIRNVLEMNTVLINNWNNVIKPDDLVFFVGDMALGSSDKFIPKLNGHIFFIRGNHDKTSDPDSLHDSLGYSYKGIDFLFVHNPKDVPEEFDGWVIHGHHHNNYPDTFPFFNSKRKRINVSAEMVRYTPVSLDYIHSLIQSDQILITHL